MKNFYVEKYIYISSIYHHLYHVLAVVFLSKPRGIPVLLKLSHSVLEQCLGGRGGSVLINRLCIVLLFSGPVNFLSVRGCFNRKSLVSCEHSWILWAFLWEVGKDELSLLRQKTELDLPHSWVSELLGYNMKRRLFAITSFFIFFDFFSFFFENYSCSRREQIYFPDYLVKETVSICQVDTVSIPLYVTHSISFINTSAASSPRYIMHLLLQSSFRRAHVQGLTLLRQVSQQTARAGSQFSRLWEKWWSNL